MNTEQYWQEAQDVASKMRRWYMDTKQYWLVAGAVVLVFMVGRWSANQTPASAGAQTRKAGIGKVEKTDVTVQQLQQVLNQNKQSTSLQRTEALANYINKQVQWKGTLKSAYSSEGQLWVVVSHKITPSWLLGRRSVGVTVNFADSEKDILLNATVGSVVTYQGILSEYTGTAKQPWCITDGQVLSVEIPQPKVKTKSQSQKSY